MTHRLTSVALLIVLAGLAVSALATSSSPAVAQETTTIAVGDLFFCDSSFQNGECKTAIAAGDTVVWNFEGAALPHTTTECGASCDTPTDSPMWDSDVINDGSTFEQTFSEAGEYLYRCNIHPTIMRGHIIVQEAAAEPTPDDSTPPDTDDADTNGDAQPEKAPVTGQGAGSTATSTGWWLLAAAIGAAGVVFFATGAFAYRRIRS